MSLETSHKKRPGHLGTITPELKETLHKRLPDGGWDSHLHIIDPIRYPLAPTAPYTVDTTHIVADANKMHEIYNMTKFCIIQPSIYANDNTCAMEGLEEVRRAGGGCVIAVVDPATIDDATIDAWQAKGVRGLRINFASHGPSPSRDVVEKMLLDHAKIVQRHDWVLQIYAYMSTVSLVEGLVPKLGVRVAFDHFGTPALPSAKDPNATTITDPYTQVDGFKSLASLLKNSDTYVKLSAAYRLTKDEQLKDVTVIAKEFLRIAPKKLVVATDWPHIQLDADVIDIEVPFFAAKMIECCDAVYGPENGQKVVEDIFRNNADALWSSRKL